MIGEYRVFKTPRVFWIEYDSVKWIRGESFVMLSTRRVSKQVGIATHAFHAVCIRDAFEECKGPGDVLYSVRLFADKFVMPSVEGSFHGMRQWYRPHYLPRGVER